MELPNWFEGQREIFEKFLLPLADHPTECLQIGAFTGDASIWMLENLPRCHLVDVDTWEGSEEMAGIDWAEARRVYDERTIQYRRSGRLLPVTTTSEQFFKTYGAHGRRSFDFIYIDGRHKASYVMEDAIGAWRTLRVGGILAFDDYGWHSDKGEAYGPELAIDCFLRMHVDSLQVLLKEWQVWLERTQ